MGKDILRRDSDSNRVAGLASAHDRFPSFFTDEKLLPFGSVCDVSYDEIEEKNETHGGLRRL